CIFVHRSPEELASVCALLSDNLRALDKIEVVDEQCASFAGDYILRFMEAERAELPETPQCPAFVPRHQPLRRVLDHQQSMLAGDLDDPIHLASHPHALHGHYCTASARPGCRAAGLGSAERIPPSAQ